jgi:NitT/TauT family transport system ATP-binding protein
MDPASTDAERAAILPKRGARAVSFECRRVCVDFQLAHSTRRVLNDINIDVYDGEFLSILGASGSGKTTLLKVLGGLLGTADGSLVQFKGRIVDSPPERVVTVFQDYASSLLPWRSVDKNVALGLEGKTSTMARKQRVASALEMVGLPEHAKDYPWQLSGGMQQRVQIARALAMEPSVLLMDEPFGSLDAMTKASLQDQLHNVHLQTGATIIFITHDIEEAIYLSNRVLILGGKPSTIVKELIINLPRDRDQVSTKESALYLALRHQIYDFINGPINSA